MEDIGHEKEALLQKLKYEHPLTDRYASKEMSYLWSPQKKFSTWRVLWLALAECEKELGRLELGIILFMF
jgi:hypothetical protein